MIKEISAKDINGKDYLFKISGDPDQCPVCHNRVTPIFIYTYVKEFESIRNLEIIYRCPNRDCQSLFIAYLQATRPSLDYFILNSTSPWTIEKRVFSELIQKVSKIFCEIYNQALAAEKRKLFEICGGGYRKALEFLIKDYSISKHKEKKTEIEGMWLSECIKKYIDEGRIKECAKRAIWLGNDEVHYYRKWKDKDLEDLKNLIELTVNWIELVLRSEKYTEEMKT